MTRGVIGVIVTDEIIVIAAVARRIAVGDTDAGLGAKQGRGAVSQSMRGIIRGPAVRGSSYARP